jgi:intracellular sulfur oxidation DsrE/DsrF family protein
MRSPVRRSSSSRIGLGARLALPASLGVALVLSSLPAALQAQWEGSETGPAIPDFGPVFEVEGIEVPAPTDMEYKVVFDVVGGTPEPGGLSRDLNTVARYINMHVRNGVPLEQIDVAVVLHGLGSRDALGPEAFQARFGVENPNVELINQLAAVGVDLYICGQSAMSLGYSAEEVHPEVKMSLSALTMRTILQNQGYQVVR